MFLLDTNVVSESRKGRRTDIGVQGFLRQLDEDATPAFLSVITLGELRRGVDKIRYRGDEDQATRLEGWLDELLEHYSDRLLDFGQEEAQLWGHLRVPHHENAIDKQIAATALTYDLTLVTRNTRDFRSTGVRLLNPFSA